MWEWKWKNTRENSIERNKYWKRESTLEIIKNLINNNETLVHYLQITTILAWNECNELSDSNDIMKKYMLDTIRERSQKL